MNENIIKLNLDINYFKNNNISDTEIDDLINFEKKEKVKIFTQKNKKWKLKDSRTLIKECHKKKNKILRNNNVINSKVKNECDIKNIDNILSILDKNCIESYEN
uniref:Uncharacterized protein n=1 Tax=Megaviridae environmental sample TaxID=1737588 RepID=A0A5J6VKZ5_9VIRU|nr:MAG: hypothetical protein [Megaviridae environmental sample]